LLERRPCAGSLENRYLDGHETLFPVTQAAWQKLREDVDTLVEAMATVPGRRRRRRADRDEAGAAAQGTTDDQARRIVEQVRPRTLDLMGDHAGALAIVERELPSKSTS
jgi:hypothetical protein